MSNGFVLVPYYGPPLRGHFIIGLDGMTTGRVIGVRRCRRENCIQYRYTIEWPDGTRTVPCFSMLGWSKGGKCWHVQREAHP